MQTLQTFQLCFKTNANPFFLNFFFSPHFCYLWSEFPRTRGDLSQYSNSQQVAGCLPTKQSSSRLNHMKTQGHPQHSHESLGAAGMESWDQHIWETTS